MERLTLLVLLCCFPVQVFAGEARIPISIEITTPFHEMDYQEALQYCEETDGQYCEVIDDLDHLTIMETDGFTVYEVLDNEGEIENE